MIANSPIIIVHGVVITLAHLTPLIAKLAAVALGIHG